jgi:hypothetical protein
LLVSNSVVFVSNIKEYSQGQLLICIYLFRIISILPVSRGFQILRPYHLPHI